MKAWERIDAVEMDGQTLELRKRGESDVLLTIDGRVLMSSMLHRTEDALSRLALEHTENRESTRALTAGYGLGFTLRALVDLLPPRAQVDVVELYGPVLEWARGPIADIAGHVLSDRRVRAHVGDVMDHIAEAASGRRPRYDVIALDLMEGPNPGRMPALAPLYGQRAIEHVARALAPGGVYAVWGEEPDPSFTRRLEKFGLEARAVRVGGGGPRHVVYLAKNGELAPPPGQVRERAPSRGPSRGGPSRGGPPRGGPSRGGPSRRAQTPSKK